jgi:hypothetical protein
MPADFDISPVIEPVGPTAHPAPPMQRPMPPPSMPPGAPGAPSMTPRSRSNRLLRWLILVAAGLFVLAVASLFWGGNSFSDRNVTLSVEASDRATSGDEIVYVVRYKNGTNVTLSDLSFRFFFPEGSIVLKDGQPTTPDSEGFTVERLEPGQEGTRELAVFLIGDKGAIKTARANLIFKAGTLRSSFEKEATAATTITDLPVVMTLVAPPTAVSGASVQYILDVRNETDAALSDLKLEFRYPDGFKPTQLRPQASEGNAMWNIADLPPGEGKRFTVTGTLEGSPRDVKNVAAVLKRNLNGTHVDYVRTDAFTTLSSPLLSVGIAPREGREYASFPGDTLDYVVSYRNDSRHTFLGLRLTVLLEGEMYDASGIRVTNGYYDEPARTIVFDASGVPDLAQLPPGQSGQATFSVPLKPGLSGSAGSQAFFVKATARLSTPNIPSGLSAEDAEAEDSVITRITSQPALSAAALYDGGAGSGPLPPQVGQPTTFTIRWQVSNPGNEVRNAKATATLSPGVSWQDAAVVVGGSAPTYDAASRTVTWNIGTVPFGIGNGSPRYEATFRISIQPSSSQVGQSVGLSGAAALVGSDAFTGAEVRIQAPALTTENIEGHKDAGRVVQ